jgi:hypothetical protein
MEGLVLTDRRRTVVLSCFNQDHEMDLVDFRTMRRRLSQYGVDQALGRPLPAPPRRTSRDGSGIRRR